MLEILFAAIGVLIVLILVLSRYYDTRFRALERKMEDMTAFQQSVKDLSEAVYDLKSAEKKETKTQPVSETKDTANSIVPVGQRQPAVVEARPLQRCLKVEKSLIPTNSLTTSSPSSWQRGSLRIFAGRDSFDPAFASRI